MSSLLVNYLAEHMTGILTIVSICLGGLWLWVKYNYSFWKRRNVPYVEPLPLFGNFKTLITWDTDICSHFQSLYNHKVGVNQPVIGLYSFYKPCLLIRDLELIKSILIKDFHNFSDRFSSSDPHSDSLGADNLFFVKNPKWKEIRVKLTPVFTSGKIKQMLPLIVEIGKQFDRYISALPVDPERNAVMLEVKELNSLYTTDVIASVAYGIEANSFKDPNGEFRRNGKHIFHFTRRRALEFTSMFFMPILVRMFGFKVFSKESTNFIRDTLNYVIEERIKSGAKRNDLIDILVEFRKEAESVSDKEHNHFLLEGDCLVAQAAIFFTAGFETTSSTMSFALYELAKRQDLQQRLRDEIREHLKESNGELSYDMIMDMKYLHCVIQEVLRFYPPLPFLDRVCTLRNGESGYSLKSFGSDYSLPNGMPVFIPIQAIHRDPKYFPNPEVFDPDRFLPENKNENNLNAYMPFGVGPHNCIGDRFGLMQAKIGLISFLRNHYVTPCEKSHKTMKFDPRAIIIQSQGGIYCNIHRDPLL